MLSRFLKGNRIGLCIGVMLVKYLLKAWVFFWWIVACVFPLPADVPCEHWGSQNWATSSAAGAAVKGPHWFGQELFCGQSVWGFPVQSHKQRIVNVVQCKYRLYIRYSASPARELDVWLAAAVKGRAPGAFWRVPKDAGCPDSSPGRVPLRSEVLVSIGNVP